MDGAYMLLPSRLACSAHELALTPGMRVCRLWTRTASLRCLSTRRVNRRCMGLLMSSNDHDVLRQHTSSTGFGPSWFPQGRIRAAAVAMSCIQKVIHADQCFLTHALVPSVDTAYFMDGPQLEVEIAHMRSCL